MSLDPDREVSAQVLLRPAGGGSWPPVPSAEDLAALAPSPASVARTVGRFRDLGFTVSAAEGPMFSITAPVRVFEAAFGTKLRESRDGGVRFARGRGSSLELPASSLPSGLPDAVEALTFTAPPDFGPGRP